MNKLIASIIAIISAITLSAQTPGASGMAPYELNVKEFNELKVVDAINVEYFCNPALAGKVQFESTSDVASAIIFDPNGKGKLEIKLANRSVPMQNLPTVRVYSSYLTKVENSGDSTLRVLSVAPGAKFEARLIGNGNLYVRDIKVARADIKLSTGKGTINVSGSCQSANISLTGSGTIDAFGLQSADATCKLLGTGWIKCSAADNLNISGAGSGTVSYKGKPVTRVKTMGIKVKSFDD